MSAKGADVKLKNQMKKTQILFMVVTFICLQAYSLPKSFVREASGGNWSSILIREDLTYDAAFNEVLDVVAKIFEMDMISKEAGYGRTNWLYTWNTKGKFTKKYRTRVIFKFSADRSKVDIKTEAEFGGEPHWIRGFDTRLLHTIKQDISGIIGRTTL